MKTKSIIAILLICASNFSIAGPKSRGNETSTTIPVLSDYDKISVGKNISVVFVKMPESIAVIHGNNKSSGSVDIKVVEGTLFITSNRHVATNSVTIYLPAKDLAEINLRENAKIRNEEILKCKNLTVYFREGSYASLITQGKVELKSPDDIEVSFERKKTFSFKQQ